MTAVNPRLDMQVCGVGGLNVYLTYIMNSGGLLMSKSAFYISLLTISLMRSHHSPTQKDAELDWPESGKSEL